MIESDLPTNLAIMVDEGMGYFISGEGVLPFFDERRICLRPIGGKPQYITHYLRGAEISPSAVSRKRSLSF